MSPDFLFKVFKACFIKTYCIFQAFIGNIFSRQASSESKHFNARHISTWWLDFRLGTQRDWRRGNLLKRLHEGLCCDFNWKDCEIGSIQLMASHSWGTGMEAYFNGTLNNHPLYPQSTSVAWSGMPASHWLVVWFQLKTPSLATHLVA